MRQPRMLFLVLACAFHLSICLRAEEWVVQTLHRAESLPREPAGAIIALPDGGFLGRSVAGGRFDHGTLYQVTPDHRLVTLFSFGGTNGSYPSDLIRARDGTLYGATSWDGENGTGGIFKFENGVITILAPAPPTRVPGRTGEPVHLLQGLDANLYGTWRIGSPTNYTNLVFRLSTNGTISTLAMLDGSHGFVSRLAQSSHPSDFGTIYGVTGDRLFGSALFKITVEGQLSPVPYDLKRYEEHIRFLVTGGDGRVYGVKESANPAGFTVFRIDQEPSGNVLTAIASVPAPILPDTDETLTSFEAGADGKFYGATGVGFDSPRPEDLNNQIFSLTTDGALTRIATAMPDCSDWNSRECNAWVRGLARTFDGPLYGISGRMAFLSTSPFIAFQITSSGERTPVASFTSSEGPGLLEQSSDGSFLAVRSDGGFYGSGSIIRLAASGEETTLASFDWKETGRRPETMFLANDGNFYGYTSDGGPFGRGTIFKLKPDGHLTTLFPRVDQVSHSLTNATPSSLIEGDDGMLYFTAFLTNQPNIFQITPGGELSPLVEMGLFARLVGSRNGLLFGVGGIDFAGAPTLFTLKSTTSNIFFTYPRTDSWFNNVLLAQDGNLYGTALEYSSKRPVSSVFFRLTPSGAFTELSRSEVFIHLSYSTLFEGLDGNFYGTALFQDNTIWKILRIARDGTVTILSSLAMGQALSSPRIIHGRDGILYGTILDLNPDGFAGATRLFRLLPAPNLRLALASNSEVTLTWNSFTGGVYRVEYKSSLSDSDWSPVAQDITAGNESSSLTDSQLDGKQRFYRARLYP